MDTLFLFQLTFMMWRCRFQWTKEPQANVTDRGWSRLFILGSSSLSAHFILPGPAVLSWSKIFDYKYWTTAAKKWCVKAGKSYWGGRVSSVDLLELSSLDELIFILKIIFSFVTKHATLMRRSTVHSLLAKLVFSGG